jgi:hypothetical protein
MSSKNFYGLTGDVTVDGGILNVGNAQLYANTETSNVGIGTPNPEFELDVRGDANVHNLYATYLHGDGSNIENIVSSQWEGSPGDPIYYASNVGIANTSPVTTTMQIGSNVVIDDVGSNVMHVTGNVHATRFIGDGAFLENIASNLHEITTNGNVTTNTVQFDGSTSLVTTGSVGIANTAPVHNLDIGSNLYVEDAGSNVLYVTGNIYADYLVGDGSQLTGIAASLDQIVDQGNTVSNTIQIVSGQDATSNIGLVTHDDVGISVSNTNPTGAFQFGVGSNLLVNVYSSNVLTVDGNVLAQKMTLGTVTVTPAYNLQQITTKGATTSQTLILENATTGLTTTSNVGIANTAPVHTLDVGSNLYVEDTGSNVLTVTGNVSVSGDLNVGSNLSVEDTGSNVLSVTGNVSVSNRLDVGSNLHIENLRVAEVASNLVTYDSTTGELMDSGGLFSNKLAVVSEQPPIALTGASTVVTNHGTYTIEASSTSDDSTIQNLFDKDEQTVWRTDNDPLNLKYNSLDGSYAGSASLVTGIDGEWVKITMPYKTILRHVKIESTNRSIKNVTLVGLNADGLTWTSLKTVDNLNEETSTIIVNATSHHKTYGLIVRATNVGSSQAEIGDLRLFTESFSIDGGKVEMASSVVMGGETTIDQHGPHSRGEAKLKKYPEIVFEEGKFDRNDSTNTYTQAGYTVTASSQQLNGYKIAAKLYEDNFPVTSQFDTWQTKNNIYDSNGDATSDYALTGITGGVGSRNGSYTTLELPHKIKLSYIQIQTRNSDDFSVTLNPKQIYVYGSNNGSSWTQVGSHIFTNVPTSAIWQKININSTTPYNYFALQVTSVLENESRSSICQLRYYGYEELATQGDTSVDTTFTSIMNTPQTTGANVYTDAKLSSDFTNHVTGPTPVGTAAVHDNTNKYWEMNGQLTSNIAVEANTFLEGDAPHSVSVWFNSSNLEANVSNTCVFSISDQEKLDSMNLDLQSNTWHNLTYAYQGEGGSRVTYLDGRKVAEDQAEDTFGDYPPFAMTGYSQGGYVVSASSECDAWNAFDDEGANTYWGTYGANSDSGVPAGSTTYRGGTTGANSGLARTGVTREVTVDTLGVSHTGSWVDMETPNKLKVSSFKVHFGNVGYHPHSPTNYRLFGRNSTSDTWVKLFTIDGAYPNGTTPPQTGGTDKAVHTVDSTVFYKYHRWVCTKLHSTASDGTSLNNNGGLARVMLVRGIEFYGTEENSSIPIQIGGGNIDKVANFRVYDKFVGEDQALEIWDAQKDAFGRAKSSMTLHKGRLGLGTTEPEGRLAVLDEPHNLEEFPPRAMTDYKTYFEGHGEFCVSSGDPDPSDAWSSNTGLGSLFDKGNTQANTHYYRTSAGSFDSGAPGYYAGSNSIGGISGAWIRIDFPYRAKLQSMNILTRSDAYNGRAPRDGYLLGKNSDEDEWTIIHEWTGALYYQFIERKFTIEASKYYSSYALVATRLLSAAETDLQSTNLSRMNISEWRLFGTREQGQSVLHDGQLTLTKNLNVPRIGPPIDADDTPRRDRLVVEYNTSTNPTFEGAVRDTSGRGFHGALFGGAYYDATEKALRFDGPGDYTEVQLPSHQVKGEWIHSVSCWVKADVINGEEAVWNIGDRTGQASGIVGSASTLAFNNLSPTLRWYFYNADAHTSNFTVATGQWYHITCVYTGGVSSATSQTIYVNGVEYVFNIFAGAGGALNFDANRDRILMLGRLPWSASSDFDGSISNFKLYDCALTASEVKTLYDMGRCSNAIPKTLHIMGGMMRYNNDINRLQIHNGVKWFTIGGISATGGTLTYADGYAIHTFTSSGTFTVTAGGGDVEYLMVAGGGGGSNTFYCGGGGAGGMLTGTTTINAGSYIITVGGGGATGTIGTIGGDSQFNALTANGGGGGGGVNNAGTNGGSGGGGGYAGAAGVVGAGMFGGTGLAGQGNNGGRGNGYPGYGWGGGGGGAGTAGTTAQASPSVSVPGDGGDGVQSSITGTATYYAGGAGGRIDGAYSASGGLGGGGSGGTGSNADGTAGGTNTGGGGGPSKAGGSGIVIIRYLV